MDLLNLLVYIGCLIVSLVFAVGLLFIVFVAVIYLVGYVYDCFLGNSLLKIWMYLGKKYSNLYGNRIFKKIWGVIEEKDLYLRYETPLFAFCFSYMAVYIIALFLPIRVGTYVIASFIYLLCYFIGMARRCYGKKEYYVQILSNNLDFLKLSFLPLAFIITIVGFICTITGLKVQEIPWKDISFWQVINGWITNMDESNMVYMFIRLLILGVILLLLLYLISLPIQVISYFIIILIQYFSEHNKPYIKLFKIYLDVLKRIKTFITG